jgi:protein-S-isoprenylcysteine O-methyltransferase Ste14
MTIGLLTLAATALLVFGRSIQQQNVVGGHYQAAAVTSYLLAAGEIAVIGAVVVNGWSSWPWIGTGGAIGVTAGMWAHRRWARRAGPACQSDRGQP